MSNGAARRSTSRRAAEDGGESQCQDGDATARLGGSGTTASDESSVSAVPHAAQRALRADPCGKYQPQCLR